MLQQILEHNIDNRVLSMASKILSTGGLVAYPTDTSWGIGCSVQSKSGIAKLKKLKGDFKKQTLTLICSNISQISEVAELNNPNFKFIKRYVPGPFVFVLSALNTIEKKINMKRIEIGVRIPNNPVPISIVESLGNPIFSITAAKTMVSEEKWWDEDYAQENLFEFGWELEEIKEIDLILDTDNRLTKNLSTVIDLQNGEIEIIREGLGII